MGTYPPFTGPLGLVVWPGTGILHSQGIPLIVYLPNIDVGLPITVSTPLHPLCIPPFLPIWINVASLNPWILDFHTAHFSDNTR